MNWYARVLITLGMLLCALNPAHAARPSKPMELFVGNRIETGSGKVPQHEALVQALKRAGAQRNWVMTPNADGTVRAHLAVRTHTLDVLIRFDGASTFDVSYLDSGNLGYQANPEDPQRPLIHPQYNNWVKNLVGDIRREIMQL